MKSHLFGGPEKGRFHELLVELGALLGEKHDLDVG